MKYGLIIDSPFDFEPGKYYCIIQDDQILDRFFCADVNRAAIHLQTYKERGCEIWKYLNAEEARAMREEIRQKSDYYFTLFCHSQRSCAGNLNMICSLSTLANRIYKIFLQTENRIK